MRKFTLLRGDVCFRNAMEKQSTVFTFTFSLFTLYSLCLGVFVAGAQSIKNNKLCKTNPIPEKPNEYKFCYNNEL